MDIYGNPIEGGSSLENGGTIDGSLEIKQDLQVDGNVVIDGSLTVDTIISDLDVEDALITCGVNNPQDLLNTGLLMGHNFSTTARYGGIVRRATDKRLVALQSVAPKPMPTGIIASSDAVVECAELATDKILSDSNNLAIDSTLITLPGSNAITYDGKPQQGILSAVADFIFQGQQRTAIRAGNGRVSIESQGLNSDIILEAGENVIIDAGANSGDSVSINAPSGDITLTSNADMVLETTGQIDLLGAVVVCNKGSNQFFLPADRGSANQVLTTDGLGGTTWQTPPPANPFDQTLNTTDNVRFAQVNIGAVSTGFTLPTARGTLGQYMRQNAAGIVSWVDFPEDTPSFGSFNIQDNGTATPLSIVGTYFLPNGTFSAGDLNDFTFLTNRLTYTGVSTGDFQINVSLSWIHSGASNADLFRLALFKNGSIITGSAVQGQLDDNANFPRNACTQILTSLSTGDIIDFRLSNADDTTGVTVRDVSFTAFRIGNFSTITGDVEGPASSVINSFAQYSDTTGKVLKDEGILTLTTSVGNPSFLTFDDPLPIWRIDNGLQNFQWRMTNFNQLELSRNDTIGGPNKVVYWDTVGSSVNIRQPLKVNDGNDQYSMPITIGSSGQVLTDVNGDGNLSWQDIVIPQPYKLIHGQDNPNTVQNTAAELSILVSGTPGAGSRTLPANTPNGSVVHYIARGTFAYAVGGLRLRFRANGVELSNTLITPPGAILSYGWSLDVLGNIQNNGNDYDLSGTFSYIINPATGEIKTEQIASFGNPNLTLDNTLDITIQFTAASPNNRLTTTNASIDLKIPDSASASTTILQQLQQLQQTIQSLTA